MKPKSSFATFGITSNAEEGVKFPLFNPVTGADTGNWLKLRGVDSKVFQQAEAHADHAQAVLSAEMTTLEKAINADKKKSDDERLKALSDLAWSRKQRADAISRELLANVVIDWTNKELDENGQPGDKIPVTIENVTAFFLEAPHLQDQIDNFSFNRNNFIDQSFKKPSTD